MCSSANRLTAGFLLIVFSGISLAGHGLHFLPGLGHDQCHSHQAANRQPAPTAHSHACCHLHDHPADPASEDARAEVGESGVECDSQHDDDCWVCRFFAQAKLPGCCDSRDSQLLPIAATSVVLSLADVRRIFEHAGRGPPASASAV